ncbi:MAG: DNA replication/repair protein RecF [Nocardioidaceae bacterium]
MYVAHLSLHDFRSYPRAEVAMYPGVTGFIGPNGQGKTNLVEAVDYLSTLGSHRVAAQAPLVRQGADHAVIRANVIRDDRAALLEVELNPGRSDRARVNRAPLPRARELVGLLKTVLFSPEDLALVKGDPSDRRRFVDTLLVLRAPRLAGVRADYDRVLRQRNTLLKTAGAARRATAEAGALHTLEVWDEHLARTGAELLQARLGLLQELGPHLTAAYADVAAGAADGRTGVSMSYHASMPLPEASVPSRQTLTAALLDELACRRADELDRGVSLVGPHRDDVLLSIGELPARGYASHGESWSLALALRLAAFDLLRADGDDPVLILDDVFAELDGERRDRLAIRVAPAEQVLVTAAVAQDVPDSLKGGRFDVADGRVTRVD